MYYLQIWVREPIWVKEFSIFLFIAQKNQSIYYFNSVGLQQDMQTKVTMLNFFSGWTCGTIPCCLGAG
jgi:hypothetical protein